MLRVTPSQNADAAKQYFGKSLVRDDYYSEGQEIAGMWGGKAAERLGLSGKVDQESYFALCDNLDPKTREKLTPRQKDNRRAGYDFTFSAPKSVSVMYKLTGNERILTAFRDSVKETMDEMEAEMKTRVRKGGNDQDRVTGNVAWAESSISPGAMWTANPIRTCTRVSSRITSHGTTPRDGGRRDSSGT